MDTFLLIVLTAFTVFDILKRRKKKVVIGKMSFSQSGIHSMIKDLLPTNAELKSRVPTQSILHQQKRTVRVIFAPDGNAYWVNENTFYCAKVVDGEFDLDSAQPINTENLSKKEIDKLLIILDRKSVV